MTICSAGTGAALGRLLVAGLLLAAFCFATSPRAGAIDPKFSCPGGSCYAHAYQGASSPSGFNGAFANVRVNCQYSSTPATYGV